MCPHTHTQAYLSASPPGQDKQGPGLTQLCVLSTWLGAWHTQTSNTSEPNGHGPRQLVLSFLAL